MRSSAHIDASNAHACGAVRSARCSVCIVVCFQCVASLCMLVVRRGVDLVRRVSCTRARVRCMSTTRDRSLACRCVRMRVPSLTLSFSSDAASRAAALVPLLCPQCLPRSSPSRRLQSRRSLHSSRSIRESFLRCACGSPPGGLGYRTRSSGRGVRTDRRAGRRRSIAPCRRAPSRIAAR
jgi:hypothetical protein